MEKDKNIPKNINYNVPEDYFIDFQERLQVQIEFEELVGPKKEAGFKVPDGYFSEFSEKITQQTKQPTKVISIHRNKWMYAVASIAAILIFIFTLLPTIFGGDTPYDPDSDTIAEYLETNNSILTVYDFEEILTDDELDDLSFTIELEDTELIDYLDITTDQYDLMIQ